MSSVSAAPEQHGAGAEHHEHLSYIEDGKGLMSWLITLDHKRIGVMYLISVLFMFFLGGVFALTLRFELLEPGTIFSAKTYNQLFTLHGAIMVFLFIIPSIPAALGNIILPLQLGAKDVAFPRLNLLSFYVYCVGAAIAVFSIVSGEVDTGWTFYTPYSTDSSGSVISMTFAAFILGFSSILTGVNFIATIHKLRAPGQTWFKLPLFIWALYSTSIIQIMATPVLAITLLLLIAEKVLGVGIFDPKMGGDPVLYQHFFWFYSHPAVYIMILPGFGIISELITTFCKRDLFGYIAMAFSTISIAVISFLVWGHHMFTSGQSELANTVFSFLTFFVAIPTAIKMFNWATTMWRGSISFATPMMYTLAFMFLFAIGGLTGLFLGTLSVDIHLHDTYFVVAHFHYVMMGGTVIAFLGGLHYWWPKITGKMYNEKLGQIGSVIIFVGFNLTFFTQFIMGAQGMPRRYHDYIEQYQPMHVYSTYGSWILAVGFLLIASYLAKSLISGEKAPSNPWGATTLEWQIASPPITHNFLEEPVVKYGPYERRDGDGEGLIRIEQSSS